ncbi:hypothetical protein CcaverHIS641_0408680 [Cutaneotrichosporon cavernicola]|nr:hypothetical protein CcaverHIS641_0408680 [Cutaneotrichosporon cavernicola]
MFFTDELLMGKRGSLGIIWLVSTLGLRNKRVNRKALEKVEIPRTCDLIASPPEPLALRLSGQLLVGVARVYSQNYEHFYSDVQTFDSALRRSFALGFGPMGNLAAGAELDLPGGGRTRLELITFTDNAPGLEGYLGIDSEFANIDWMNPDITDMDHERRHTTPLESLRTQSLRSEEDVDMEDPRSNRHRNPLHTTPNTTNEKALTFKPYKREADDVPDEFNPINLDLDLDLPEVPSRLDGPGGPEDPNKPSLDGMMSDFIPSDDTVDPGNFDIPQDLGPEKFILPDQLHSSPTRLKRKGSSSQEASDVESQLLPAPKPKKKRVKRTKFDHDLELDLDPAEMGAAYVDAMVQRRRELNAKSREKEAAKMAGRLLGGSDSWFKFMDPEMSSFISGFSAINTFKWQLDVKSGSNVTLKNPADPVEPLDLVGNSGPQLRSGAPFIDPQLIIDVRGDGNLLKQTHMDYQGVLDIPDVPRNDQYELELPRSASDLPWAAQSASSDFPNSLQSGQTTPTGIKAPRVSDMSPLEASIRKRQRHSSIAGDGPGYDFPTRSRSGSVLSVNFTGHDHVQLVLDGDADQISEDNFNARFPCGHLFAPTTLATLEDQCRGFFRTMSKTGADELELTDVAPRGQSKRVAAAAFRNCLTLATKGLLHLSQDAAYGPITIRIPAA